MKMLCRGVLIAGSYEAVYIVFIQEYPYVVFNLGSCFYNLISISLKKIIFLLSLFFEADKKNK